MSNCAINKCMSIFTFNESEVRVVLVDGRPWWVARDVAKVLGYRDAANAIRVLRPDQVGTHQVSTPGGVQMMRVISLFGLNRLIMRSERPEAEQFQDWITDEVIPALLERGTYTVPGAGQPRSSPPSCRDPSPGIARSEARGSSAATRTKCTVPRRCASGSRCGS